MADAIEEGRGIWEKKEADRKKKEVEEEEKEAAQVTEGEVEQLAAQVKVAKEE